MECADRPPMLLILSRRSLKQRIAVCVVRVSHVDQAENKNGLGFEDHQAALSVGGLAGNGEVEVQEGGGGQ